MLKIIVKSVLLLLPCLAFGQDKNERDRWQQRARNVTIIRDHYGVAHIYGKTDADCVFGLMYAQCEDDFRRVEENLYTMLGRTAEAKGPSEIFEDLSVRIMIDSAEAMADYQRAPEWLKKLLQAHADGINYYLYKHPEVKPAVLKKIQPWYHLTYTDGSIAAIRSGNLTSRDLEQFYASKDVVSAAHQRVLPEEKLIGSNGFAVAPFKSKSGKPLFFINPHVTMYFRPEVHLQSEEGLHVYGAVTWGQMFVYQGFNEHLGFMHTSTEADADDLYAETVIRDANGKYHYQYDGSLRPVEERSFNIAYREDGALKTRTFKAYYTHHGPVIGMKDGKWLSLKTSNRSLNGLVQSWQRTKAKSMAEFTKLLALAVNVSNNTVYADKAGNIAYWHGNFMPRRDTGYDWSQPVDGSTSKTEWKGMHTMDELVHIINPANGWIQNTNNTPFSVSGTMSPRRSNFPSYMAPDGENFRGLNAVRLFEKSGKLSLEDLTALAYDPHLTAFDTSLPILFEAYRQQPVDSLREIIDTLRAWDRNASVHSVAANIAIHWAEKLNARLRANDPFLFSEIAVRYGQALRHLQGQDIHSTSPQTSTQNNNTGPLLRALQEVKELMVKNWGTWKIPWGDVNRIQRIANGPTPVFSDSATSYPVGRAASIWGQLPSFVSNYAVPASRVGTPEVRTKKRYGTGGNSFVCAVEFGDKVRAKSILAGGNSGNPASPHFFDQGKMFAEGSFKDVLFYKEDVMKHKVTEYHPGE